MRFKIILKLQRRHHIINNNSSNKTEQRTTKQTNKQKKVKRTGSKKYNKVKETSRIFFRLFRINFSNKRLLACQIKISCTLIVFCARGGGGNGNGYGRR